MILDKFLSFKTLAEIEEAAQSEYLKLNLCNYNDIHFLFSRP